MPRDPSHIMARLATVDFYRVATPSARVDINVDTTSVRDGDLIVMAFVIPEQRSVAPPPGWTVALDVLDGGADIGATSGTARVWAGWKRRSAGDESGSFGAGSVYYEFTLAQTLATEGTTVFGWAYTVLADVGALGAVGHAYSTDGSGLASVLTPAPSGSPSASRPFFTAGLVVAMAPVTNFTTVGAWSPPAVRAMGNVYAPSSGPDVAPSSLLIDLGYEANAASLSCFEYGFTASYEPKEAWAVGFAAPVLRALPLRQCQRDDGLAGGPARVPGGMNRPTSRSGSSRVGPNSYR